MEPLSLTLEQGEKIVRKHLASHGNSTVQLIKEIKNNGYSYTSGTRTYILDLVLEGARVPSCLCFITISHPNPTESDSIYRPNTLPITHDIISRIRAHTDIPIPNPTLDTTLDLVPFHFLLSPTSPMLSSDITPLSTARKCGLLSPEDIVLVDLQIGRFLGQLHSGVQNDWFGPMRLDVPSDPSYSWQETFTLLLETLLSEFQSSGVDFPYEEIRGHLSRAIGFFLFDDVEAPSLIWFTGSEDDIYIALPSRTAPTTRGIAAILPNVAHAIWGDPLLESFFLPPAPSSAVQEGYLASGGKETIVVPRQKTKRIWYSLFLGLIILRERSHKGCVDDPAPDASNVDKDWAMGLILKSIKALSDAPCY
ncbi:hypothetical protein CVT25_001541 [Psilocybe cyanescens]|uniref:Aminoglycoside phosphotransferase domain-containing protein n=1 Tax=Psilocybe cyanescens TaxID=93625 RepID=A0A409WPU9_PSICY|nr:hypothetical protein CVT25_001541 [Psilocybe cyanescens]